MVLKKNNDVEYFYEPTLPFIGSLAVSFFIILLVTFVFYFV